MFTHLGDFKPVIWNFSEDCLQSNNKSERYKIFVKNRTHNLEIQTQLFHISKKTWKLHYLSHRNRFLFSLTNFGLTICSVEKAKLLLIIHCIISQSTVLQLPQIFINGIKSAITKLHSG